MVDGLAASLPWNTASYSRSKRAAMKRVLLFLATNLAVIVVLSIIARLFGIDQYIAAQGGSYTGLLVFAALFGFGGAIISLLMSKWSAKRMMDVRVIDSAALV